MFLLGLMTGKESEERTKIVLDWDELKLWRGEVGPNVADELASK